MKSIVIGLGIGNLYVGVLKQLGAQIVTVDPDPGKSADYDNLEDALGDNPHFDTAHVCTPNYTHGDIARQVASHADMVFIEKPGLKTSEQWESLLDDFPGCRFMMVKNNMWRDGIAGMQTAAAASEVVDIKWVRKDCVPNPGSWFTTRELSYGGVSRDLMPHLLSVYIALNPDWENSFPDSISVKQLWHLKDITGTSYGVVNPDGTYDVDDYCRIEFDDNKFNLTAAWRSMNEDVYHILCTDANGHKVFDLGWCPDEAYLAMLQDALSNRNNPEFWELQRRQDLWIHQVLDTLGQ